MIPRPTPGHKIALIAVGSLLLCGAATNGARYERVVSTSSGSPDWIEQGPASIDPAAKYNQAGAIQALLIDPTNPARIFVGSVNGGVWQTTNGTDVLPFWRTGTDRAPSLSIADLHFDPLDASRNTIYAAVGDFSSYELGGPLVGLLRSTDAGGTWNSIGGSTLMGIQFQFVLPTATVGPGRVILAAGSQGVYRSVDGGVTFSALGGAQGLPQGPALVSSLIADAGSTTTYYAAFPRLGIYRTDDAGAIWQNITGNVPIDGIGGIASAASIKLSMSAAPPNPLYAAVSTVIPPGSNLITGLYRSDRRGASWNSLGAPNLGQPNPAIGVSTTFFAFAADPKDSDIVFAAGDQGVNNLKMGQIGADGSMKWMPCSGPPPGTADGSDHHGDSRNIQFDSSGNLLLSDDGGVYRLSDPTDPTKRSWTGINGTLNITEISSIAYDTLNSVAFSGHQDTGSAQQTTEEAGSWQSVAGGDGSEQGVDNSAGDRTIWFVSTHGLLTSLTRTTYDSTNHVLQSSRNVLLANAATPTVAGSGLVPGKPYGGFILNRLVPSRMILFGPALYEGTLNADGSGNYGDTIRTLTLPGAIKINDNVHQTAAFGGRLQGKPNPGVLFVAFDVSEMSGSGLQEFNRLYGRTADGAPVVKLPFPDATIMGVSIDPVDSRVVYAVSATHIFKSTTSGLSWTDITTNLPLTQLRTVEVVAGSSDTPDASAVVVGGQNGIFISKNGGSAPWTRLGTHLPNVPVNDMHDYPASSSQGRSAGENFVAATIGRGAWTWPSDVWRVNLSSGASFQPHSWQGTWASDGPLAVGDFDGDGKSDVAVWRIATKSWLLNLSSGRTFRESEWQGTWASDGPLFVGDFNGDGKSDIAVWRNASKSWLMNLSTGAGFASSEWTGAWGSDGPIITGDFNGDGKSDIMMWRDSTKSWTVNLSNGHGFDADEWKGAWGSDGPIITGDFNGDGKTDVMMWRDSTKSWTVNLSNGHGFDAEEWKGAWGSDGPIITGDFNGDGKTDVMMWRDSTKSWTVNLSNGHGFDAAEWKGAWGSDGPIITGDFNGDGKTDLMMWRDSTKSWTVNLSTGAGFNAAEWKGAWGSDGPIVTGDFNGDRKTDVIIWRRSILL